MGGEREPVALDREIAADFGGVWAEYWSMRKLPWERCVERIPELTKRGLTLMHRSIRFFDEVELENDMALQAIVLLMQLADDFLVVSEAATSETSYQTLLLPLRAPFEAVLRGSGIADWCARNGGPLIGEDGSPIGFGVGPLPGIMGQSSLDFYVLNYGSPGAELAAPDARRDFDAVVARAVPAYLQMLEKLDESPVFESDYEDELAKAGMDTIRTVKFAGPALISELVVVDTIDDEIRERLQTQLTFLLLMGRFMTVIARDCTPGERHELRASIFDADDLAIFETSDDD